MASSPRTVEREEERGLNMRTLVIASAASASAAAITSQLWIRGTWIAAAATPVIVALLSEVLNRPTEKIARAMTSDSPALPGRTAGQPKEPKEPREQARPEPREPPPSEPGPGPSAPAGEVRVYRQPSRRPSRKHIAWGAVLATAGLAFVIGVFALTATELIAGESIGKSDSRTTLVGGKSNKDRDSEREDQAPTDTGERTTPDRDQEQDQDQDRTQPTTPDETTTEPTTPEETATEQQTTPEQPAPRSQPPAAEPQASP